MKYFYDANAGQKDLISRYKALILLIKFLSCWVKIHALIFRKDKKGNKESSLTSCFLSLVARKAVEPFCNKMKIKGFSECRKNIPTKIPTKKPC